MVTDHTQEEFQRLVEDEENLIEAAARTEDVETRRSLLDVVVLMAVCDGELAEEKREFLGKISKWLEPPLDLKKVEKRAQDYRVTSQGIARRTMANARDAATMAGGRACKVLGKVLVRRGASKGDRTTDLHETE